MRKVPFHNDSTEIKYAPDGARVMPGHTHMMLAAALPPAAAPEPADPLLALSGGTVKDIVEALPNLDAAGVERLLELERAGKDRKGVIEAIELRKLEMLDLDKQPVDPPPVNPDAPAPDGAAPPADAT